MTLVLASGSPRRRVLLGLLVDAFDVVAPDVDETLPEGPVGPALEAVAARKAAAVAGDVVLAADTVVVLDGEMRGKPTDRADAGRMLRRMAGRDHSVLTALALRTAAGTRTTHAVTVVSCDPLPEDTLEAYLDSGAWQGKAGAYGIQDTLLAPFLHVSGPWSNVVGLPLDLTQDLLEAAGIPCTEAPLETELLRQNPFCN